MYIMTRSFNLRFSPASIFLITNILVSNVSLVLSIPFCKRVQSVFLTDVAGGKIKVNVKELHSNRKKKKHVRTAKELVMH
jgi:hypothetical protein